MKHTPGPWRIVVESHGDQPICDVLLEEYSGNIYPTHDIGIVDGDEYQLNHPQGFRFLAHLTAGSENIANACLIAAAPDLLEACKEAIIVISQHYSEENTCCDYRIDKIKQAIAKAE